MSAVVSCRFGVRPRSTGPLARKIAQRAAVQQAAERQQAIAEISEGAQALKDAIAEKTAADAVLARQIALVLLEHAVGRAAAAEALSTLPESVTAARRVVGRVIASHALPIDLSRGCFDTLFELMGRRRRWKIRDMMLMTIEAYGVDERELCSQRRQLGVVRPRQVAMFLCKRFTSASFPEIGRRFGGRDHSTVVHAVRRVQTLVDAQLIDCGDDPQAWLVALRELTGDDWRASLVKVSS